MKENVNPNLFLIDQPHNPPSRENTVSIEVNNDLFREILSSREDTEYIPMNPDYAMKFLAISEDNTFYVNPALDHVQEDITIGDYNEGVFPFQPKYTEYLEYVAKSPKGIKKLLVKVNAMAFETEYMPNGEAFRYDDSDLPKGFNPQTEEEFYETLYNPNGRYTNWTLVLHLGDMV